MWSARWAYRNADGQIVLLPERSPLWTDRDALLKQLEHDHPGIMPVRDAATFPGEWYRWVDEAGVERFVIIEGHE